MSAFDVQGDHVHLAADGCDDAVHFAGEVTESTLVLHQAVVQLEGRFSLMFTKVSPSGTQNSQSLRFRSAHPNHRRNGLSLYDGTFFFRKVAVPQKGHLIPP